MSKRKKRHRSYPGMSNLRDTVARIPKGFKIYLMDPDDHACTGTKTFKTMTGIFFNEAIAYRVTVCSGCGKHFVAPSHSERLIDQNIERDDYYTIITDETSMESDRRKPSLVRKSEDVPTEKEIQILPTDVLIRTETRGCWRKDHDFRAVKACIRVVQRNGVVINVRTPAVYCSTCKQFYIQEGYYQKLAYKGIPVCQFIDLEDHKALKRGEVNKAETMLHAMGYNVSSNYDYTTRQRQALLKIILKEQLLEREEIIKHLQYLVKRSEHRENMQMACNKWRSDIQFMKNYK